MNNLESLMAKKKEIESIIGQKRKQLMMPQAESTDELSLYDQHPADAASDLYEREKDAGLLEMLEFELEKVNDAIERYNTGQYGICENCGKEIEPQRLKRLVNTTLCAKCAAEIQDKFTRPAEEDITSTGSMADKGETFQIAGYEFYEE